MCLWHPVHENPTEGLPIRRQIDALAPHVDADVFHVDVRVEPTWRKEIYRDLLACEHRLWFGPVGRRATQERALGALLADVLLRRARAWRYDLINFHVAYPLMAYWPELAAVVRKPALITEHRGGYVADFGERDPAALRRARAIFHGGASVIAVSAALGRELVRFSGNPALDVRVVPNVVDPAVFAPRPDVAPDRDRYFMVSQFEFPKDPGLVLRAFHRLAKSDAKVSLRIGGFGADLPALEAYVATHGLGDRVTLLGRLTPTEIAHELRLAVALLHASRFETFSVVCAEARCCGTDVIASNVGGIPEVVGEDGTLVTDHTEDAWFEALRAHRDRAARTVGARAAVAERGHAAFAPAVVGARYAAVVHDAIARGGR